MRALSPNISVRDLYLRSCWTNEITKVEQILRLRADVNWKDQDGWSGLLIAADKNYRDLLELLLTQTGVNVNITDRYNSTPLMMACYKGHKDIVRRLCQVPGIELNIRDVYGRTALHWAVAKNRPRCVEVLRSTSCSTPSP